MVMKYIIIFQMKMFNTKYQRPIIFCNYKKTKEGGIYMLKFLSKIAEKYAKSTNTACYVFCLMHQPKMPASLIKKD